MNFWNSKTESSNRDSIFSSIVLKVTRPVNAAAAGVKDIAQGEGDLTERLTVSREDEVGELDRWFNVSTNEMLTSSNQVNISARELSRLSNNLKQMVGQFKT